MKKILFLSLIFSLAFGLSGCGQKSGQVSDTKTSTKGDVSTDICAEFSADFVYSVIHKPIVKVEPSPSATVYACDYYIDYKEDFYKDTVNNRISPGGPSILIVLDNLNVERQKEARKYLGLTLDTNPKINMENIVSYREDKSMWSVDLIINPNRFVWANYSHGAITDDQLIDLAAAMADKIQGKLKIKIEKNPVDLAAAKAAELGDSQKQVARDFLNALAVKDIQKALGMMDANQETKQGWGANFNTIKSFEIKKMEEAFKEEWTPTRQTFKATLNAEVTEQGLQIGWENGENFRWITVEKNNNVWQIHELANNP
jgi:hypothetical protein